MTSGSYPCYIAILVVSTCTTMCWLVLHLSGPDRTLNCHARTKEVVYIMYRVIVPPNNLHSDGLHTLIKGEANINRIKVLEVDTQCIHVRLTRLLNVSHAHNMRHSTDHHTWPMIISWVR